MGSVKYIAHSNEFWVKNLNDFKEGLKGYVGGEWESPVRYNYTDYKRRSKKALIKMDSEDFTPEVHHKDDYDDQLDLLEYIKCHILEGEEAIIHWVSYEHPGDMSIFKYVITDLSVQQITILEN